MMTSTAVCVKSKNQPEHVYKVQYYCIDAAISIRYSGRTHVSVNNLTDSIHFIHSLRCSG